MPDKWQWLCLGAFNYMGWWLGGADLREVSPWSNQAEKDFYGFLWSTWVFLMKLSSDTQCPQILELSASSANHSLPLASFSATHWQCLVWGGRFLSSKSWSGCSCCNEQHGDLVPEQPGRDLKWGFLSSYVPLSTSHCYWVSAAVFSPPLASGSQLPGTTVKESDGAGGSSAAPNSLGSQPQSSRSNSKNEQMWLLLRPTYHVLPVPSLLICRRAIHLVLLPDQIPKPKTIPGVLASWLASEVSLRFSPWISFLWSLSPMVLSQGFDNSPTGKRRQEINILPSVQQYSWHLFSL